MRRVLAGTLLALLVATGGGAWVLAPHTRHGPRFSEARFGEIQVGDPLAQVEATLGEPLSRRNGVALERWCYGQKPSENGPVVAQRLFSTEIRFDLKAPPCLAFDATGVAVRTYGSTDPDLERSVGLAKDEALRRLGKPVFTEPGGSYSVLYYTQPAWSWHTTFVDAHLEFDAEERVQEKIFQVIPD